MRIDKDGVPKTRSQFHKDTDWKKAKKAKGAN